MAGGRLGRRVSKSKAVFQTILNRGLLPSDLNSGRLYSLVTILDCIPPELDLETGCDAVSLLKRREADS